MTTEKGGAPKIDPEQQNPDWEAEIIAAYRQGKSDVWIRANCFKDHILSIADLPNNHMLFAGNLDQI